MAVTCVHRIMDVALGPEGTADCEVLHNGVPHSKVDTTSANYGKGKKILRWAFGLMGEIQPETSPLSVDIANDPEYRVYRYDWYFGIACIRPAHFWWDWQKNLIEIASHIVLVPADSGFGYSCVATNLNVLPPSRDTETWWQKNQQSVVEMMINAAGTAVEAVQPTAGNITKAFSAIANSLESQGKDRTNWFIYQFLDEPRNATAIEWRIDKAVMKQFGSLLKGSLILAFHGDSTSKEGSQKGIRIILRPMLRYDKKDDILFIAPTEKLEEEQQLQLEVVPTNPGKSGQRSGL